LDERTASHMVVVSRVERKGSKKRFVLEREFLGREGGQACLRSVEGGTKLLLFREGVLGSEEDTGISF